jgi:hypothetical protein
MNTQVAKKTLHEMIDQIEDDELLTLYVKLLRREIRKDTNQYTFNTTEADLVERARASLQSVEAGNTRSMGDFIQDVETWKRKQTTR